MRGFGILLLIFVATIAVNQIQEASTGLLDFSLSTSDESISDYFESDSHEIIFPQKKVIVKPVIFHGYKKSKRNVNCGKPEC